MRCSHQGCTCQVDQSGDFCSEHCREHATDADHGSHACQCGHAQCQASTDTATSRTTQDLQDAFE